MNSNDFMQNFSGAFDDTDASELTLETVFKDLEEWDSLTVLAIISMVKLNYGITISGLEINNCSTIEEIFDLIQSKKP